MVNATVADEDVKATSGGVAMGLFEHELEALLRSLACEPLTLMP